MAHRWRTLAATSGSRRTSSRTRSEGSGSSAGSSRYRRPAVGAGRSTAPAAARPGSTSPSPSPARPPPRPPRRSPSRPRAGGGPTRPAGPAGRAVGTSSGIVSTSTVQDVGDQRADHIRSTWSLVLRGGLAQLFDGGLAMVGPRGDPAVIDSCAARTRRTPPLSGFSTAPPRPTLRANSPRSAGWLTAIAGDSGPGIARIRPSASGPARSGRCRLRGRHGRRDRAGCRTPLIQLRRSAIWSRSSCSRTQVARLLDPGCGLRGSR